MSFVASLAGLHIAGVPLSGDLYLLNRGGEDATFVLSAGGFHPTFAVPRGVPELRRISLDLSPSPLIELRCEAYLAITTNTVQFGAGSSSSPRSRNAACAAIYNSTCWCSATPTCRSLTGHNTILISRGGQRHMLVFKVWSLRGSEADSGVTDLRVQATISMADVAGRSDSAGSNAGTDDATGATRKVSASIAHGVSRIRIY